MESLGSRDPSLGNLLTKPKMLCWSKNEFYTPIIQSGLPREFEGPRAKYM